LAGDDSITIIGLAPAFCGGISAIPNAVNPNFSMTPTNRSRTSGKIVASAIASIAPNAMLRCARDATTPLLVLALPGEVRSPSMAACLRKFRLKMRITTIDNYNRGSLGRNRHYARWFF
jgi:hypothetical protein